MVFSSFLWDMQRWGRFFPDKLQERGLSAETIEEWAANLEAVLVSIKVFHPCISPMLGQTVQYRAYGHCSCCPYNDLLFCMLLFAWTDSSRRDVDVQEVIGRAI